MVAGKEQQQMIGVSAKHMAERIRLFEDFLDFTLNEKDLLLPQEMLDLVPGPFHAARRLVARVILYLGGEKNQEKIRLCDMLFSQFALRIKNKKEEDQFLQPSTHSRKLRTLMGHLKAEYGWLYSFENDFSFDGGLKAVVKNMFADRLKATEEDPGRNPYSTGAKKQIVQGVSNVSQLDWTVFNEDIPHEHQCKLMGIFGAYFGLRGRKEHAFLSVNNLTHGVFEEGHPFEGYMFYGLQDLFDKSNKLTFSNQYARCSDPSNVIRIPVMDVDDQGDPGASIHRFIEKLSPGQQRLYLLRSDEGRECEVEACLPKGLLLTKSPTR